MGLPERGRRVEDVLLVRVVVGERHLEPDPAVEPAELQEGCERIGGVVTEHMHGCAGRPRQIRFLQSLRELQALVQLGAVCLPQELPRLRQILHSITIPPHTRRVSPVMWRASSLRRKATAFAMSSGCASRLNGVCILVRRRLFSGVSAISAVSVIPGATTLNRKPWGPNSTASDFVALTSAALAAAYASSWGGGALSAKMLARFTTAPCPAAAKLGSTAWISLSGALRWSARCASSSDSDRVLNALGMIRELALLTRAVTGPKRPTARSTSVIAPAGSVTSAFTAAARPPPAAMVSTTCCAPPSSR